MMDGRKREGESRKRGLQATVVVEGGEGEEGEREKEDDGTRKDTRAVVVVWERRERERELPGRKTR